MNANVACAATIVDELVRGGVADVCLAPGSRSAPLALALAADERIRLHVVIDERSAGFLALGTARGARRPAAVACTSGTAAVNLYPAIMEAHHDRVPLLVLTADRPEELRHTGANQTIDQLRLYGDSVRWFCELGAPHDPAQQRYWRSSVSRALAEATGSPSGPVHVNLAFRDPLVPAVGEPIVPSGGRAGGRPWTESGPATVLPAEPEVDALAAVLRGAERGVLLAGACDVDPAGPLELARRLAWPVLAEPSSQMRCGGNAVSTYEALLRTPFAAEHRPDVILRIGKIGLSRALGAWSADGSEQILIDRDGAWLDPQRSLQHVVRADPAALCDLLLSRIEPAGRSAWLAQWAAAEGAARRAVDDLLDAHDEPSEPRAARDLAASLPDGSTLVAGASMPVRDLDSFMAPRAGLRVTGNRGVNGIDGFVSTALGIALSTDGPAAALCGDLSLLHDQNGLLSARREDVDCVFVVINNDGGGIFSFLEQAAHQGSFERLFGTPHGIGLGALARVYGCEQVAIESARQLPVEVAARLGSGVHLLEVRTERAANVALHRELWAAVAGAVARSD